MRSNAGGLTQEYDKDELPQFSGSSFSSDAVGGLPYHCGAPVPGTETAPDLLHITAADGIMNKHIIFRRNRN
jgi:hypothetical protein